MSLLIKNINNTQFHLAPAEPLEFLQGVRDYMSKIHLSMTRHEFTSGVCPPERGCRSCVNSRCKDDRSIWIPAHLTKFPSAPGPNTLVRPLTTCLLTLHRRPICNLALSSMPSGHVRPRIHLATKPTTRARSQMTRNHVPCQTPLVHRIRTTSPETCSLCFLVPDHVVSSAEVVAHPDSLADNVHVARAMFIRPFTDKDALVVIVLRVLWRRRFNREDLVGGERRVFACGLSGLP